MTGYRREHLPRVGVQGGKVGSRISESQVLRHVSNGYMRSATSAFSVSMHDHVVTDEFSCHPDSITPCNVGSKL